MVLVWMENSELDSSEILMGVPDCRIPSLMMRTRPNW